MNPKISIVMPVYNAETFLADAIGSLQAQTFADWELIAVNDGSTDGSGAVLDALAEKDSRIRVIHQANGGICAARNRGLAEARGEYLGFMDNDDVLLPETLEENYALLTDHDADWVKFGKTELLLRGGKELKRRSTHFTQGVYSGGQVLTELQQLRADDVMTFVWDSFVRRSIVEQAGLRFDTNFTSGNEDIDFCEELAPHIHTLVVNPKCYYIHFTRLGVSASSKYSQQKMDSYLYLLGKSNARYRRFGIENTQDAAYARVVTRQIICNAVQKLVAAGDSLTFRQKRAELARFYRAPELARYVALPGNILKDGSRKLDLYCRLFHTRSFTALLLLDKWAGKLIYLLRTLRAK